jgi:hypothetical protein
MSKVSDLYDRDFVLWSETQAAALRSAKAGKVWARLEQGGFTAEQVLGYWFPELPD